MTLRISDKANLSVPRYTSYPTAPHFSGAVTAEIYKGWLQTLNPDEPLSLYLHVPFCKKMCWYCGCNTKVVARYDPVSDYADLLRQEISLLSNTLPGRFRISHIHWGGGTPTILSGDDFTSIMSLIAREFDYTENAERAIEIDPRTVDRQKIRTLAEADINRASLGIQDFSPRVQQAINRVQSYELTEEVVHTLRQAGIEKLNFDLMYGLPTQTVEDILRTVDLSHQLGPNRIALFGYAHVPWMKSHMKLIKDEDLPDTEARLQQSEWAAQRLLDLGYKQVGFDHFASVTDDMVLALEAGTLQRNFQGYTTDTATTLIGIGASSIGKSPMGYVQNSTPIHDYKAALEHGHFPVAKGIETTIDDDMRRQVIERLMCDLSVDLSAIAAKYDQELSYFSVELEALSEFEEEGLVILTNGKLSITPSGRQLVRVICALFDIYLDQGLARHSKAV
ncbi:MAG: oxygen-independent coproporphyrinogen III oxidase [Proteobacteria bacterium]|nr:oxygen-independent coproporphyrinogen III oxidase [Pseudomonadota bacterium]